MNRQKLAALSEAYIRDLLLKHLPWGTPVYLYGSRARRDERWNSDFDLWIDGELPVTVLSAVEEALEESFVPYKVDIVTKAQLRGRFGAQAKKDSVRWL